MKIEPIKKSRTNSRPRRPLFVGLIVCLLLALTAPAVVLAEVRIEGQLVRAETKTLKAVFERGVLTSLVRKSDDREFVRSSAKDKIAVYLVYPFAEAVPLGKETTDTFTPHRINDHRVEFRVHAYDGDAILTIRDDPESGDVIVEPNAYTSRPGMRSVRWMLSGIDPALNLIAPFFQGIDLPLEDPLIKNSYWYWPHRWEAGMAILHGNKGGFWVHCEDLRFLYKSLQVGLADDARCLGFDTDVQGLAPDGRKERIGFVETAQAFWGMIGPDWRDVSAAYCLGRSYVGMRAEDVLVAARYAATLAGGTSGKGVDLVAVGHVGVPALHAAALEPAAFGRVTLVRTLVSWASVIERRVTRGQYVNVVHGALREYDLPDLAATLGGRLAIEDPVDAFGAPVAPKN